jgi:hypothetical protein
VKWSTPLPGDNEGSSVPDPNGSFEFQIDAFVDVPPEPVDDGVVLQRLHNLGYNAGPEPADDIAEFQRDYKARLPKTVVPGKMDDATRNLLRDVYNASDPERKTFVASDS